MIAASELEPLVLADGTKIDPVLGKPIKEKKAKQSFVEVPSNSEAQQLVAKTRKTVAELPMPPAQMSGVAIVAFYTLFGLPDKEIALAVDGKLTIDQIKGIRKLDAYKAFMATAKTNIIENSADQVRDLFQQNAIGAARKVISIAEEDDGVLGFKASQDILDRAGHRPNDIVEHKHKMEGGLQIVVTRKDATQQVPIIDVTPEAVTYAGE